MYAFTLDHHKCIPASKFACERCDFRSVDLAEFLEHMVAEHTKQAKVMIDRKSNYLEFSCDECEYKCNLNMRLKRHKKSKHVKEGKGNV